MLLANRALVYHRSDKASPSNDPVPLSNICKCPSLLTR